MAQNRTDVLAEEAGDCLKFEKLGGFSELAARKATLDQLAGRARELGFAAAEVAAAVEAALKTATGAR